MADQESLYEILERYSLVFKEFKKKDYETLNKNHKLIYFVSGLGLSNSVHEKFIKKILDNYSKQYIVSNNQIAKILRKYKSTKELENFAIELGLDLEEAFNMKKDDIPNNHISEIGEVFEALNLQKDIRNDYLHGDFMFLNEIQKNFFLENIVEYQKKHVFLLEVFRYSFDSNIHRLNNMRV